MDVQTRDTELLQLEEAAGTIMNIIKKLRRMELVPMSYILSKVPGDTIREKVENVGVSRQTYYYWIQGRSRPSLPQAERLAELTGIPIRAIMSVHAA